MVPGTGKLAYERSKPGYGWPAFALPAPLSNRTRTGGCASKAALARLVGRLQLDRVGAAAVHRPLIPKIAWKTTGALAWTTADLRIGASLAT